MAAILFLGCAMVQADEVKDNGTADISGWRGRNQEYSVIFAPWNI